MKDKINKFFSKIKRDGFISTIKKTLIVIKSTYFSKFNIVLKNKYKKQKEDIISLIENEIKHGKYKRVIIWRSSLGYNIPLFQRPQHLCEKFTKYDTLVLYEVTKLTDKVDFIKKEKNGLYLVNYECKEFIRDIKQIIDKNIKNKYLFLASTCWDLSLNDVKEYIKEGYKLIYDYLDHLSSELSSTNELPKNIIDIHNYVVKDSSNSFIICTADFLYKDMLKKHKNENNMIFACNGVDYEHFSNLKNKNKFNFVKEYKDIINTKKPIIGYYGALAKWFDYDLVSYLAKERKEYSVVLIGAKYDTSFEKSNILKNDNVFYIDSKTFDELPYYADKFSLCILPFKINNITRSTSPIKIFEYMSLSKPIVSTDLEECRKYKSIKIGKTKEEFVKLCDKMLKIKDKEYLSQLKKDALNNTWDSKAKDIINLINKFEKK